MMKFVLGTAAMALLSVTAVQAAGNAVPKAPGKPVPMEYESTLMNNEGEDIGTVTLTQAESGVMIHIKADNLPPGEHGFHIHETASCTPQDSFADAGGHFNPGETEHGFMHEGGAHAGDMTNIFVDSDGHVEAEMLNDRVSLVQGEDGYLMDEDGSAVMVHAKADDYMSQTSGDAGDRIACGVID